MYKRQAGIRDTEDKVERIGVDKAKEYAKQADLIIYVVDASRELDQNDKQIIEIIYDKKCIILLNKTDLNVVVSKESIKGYIENIKKQNENLQRNEKIYNEGKLAN